MASEENTMPAVRSPPRRMKTFPEVGQAKRSSKSRSGSQGKNGIKGIRTKLSRAFDHSWTKDVSQCHQLNIITTVVPALY